MKIKIEDGYLEIESEHIPVYCLACGKDLGYMENLPEKSTCHKKDIYPLCQNCFHEKIHEMIIK